MGNQIKLLVLLTVLYLSAVLCQAPPATQQKREQFRVIYEWNTLNFTWPSGAAYREAVNSGKYIKENVLMSGLKHFGGKLYMTLPRLKDGVPATLAYVQEAPSMNETGPLLTPFPSWELNEIGNCMAFQSVQSMEIDRNGIMWVMDNGRTSTMKPGSGSNATCSPSLVLIDLNGNKNSIIVRYTFPPAVASRKSYLCDIVVDDAGKGYAYITDNSLEDPGIIVFSKGDSRSWKFRESNTMSAARNAIHFSLNGTTADIRINVDGIALGPRYITQNGIIERDIFYSPLSSFKLYSLPTSFLKNESMTLLSERDIIMKVSELGIKPSQTDGMIMDNAGFLYYGLVGNYSIARWDSRKSFVTEQQIIAKDMNFIQWVDRFTFDDAGNIYVVVNRLYNFVYGKVNPDEVNYRILRSHTGTKSYVYGITEQELNQTIAASNVKPISNVQGAHQGHVQNTHTVTNTHISSTSSVKSGSSFRYATDVATLFAAFVGVFIFTSEVSRRF